MSWAPTGADGCRQVVCPYEPAHVVEAARLPFHLAKCSRAAKARAEGGAGGARLLVCPFNASHHVAATQLDAHVASCPDRGRFDGYAYSVGDTASALPHLPPVPHIPPDENWDDNDAAPYNPREYLENNEGNVMQVRRGAQPAERRAFRMEQRRNFTKRN